MPPSLTLFFIVEPPNYLYMGCHLAASIRKFLPPEVRMIGYCPRHRWAEMEREPLEVLRRLRCEVRPIDAEGRFDPAYPHGNKILATLEPKETDFAAFLDSDMLFLQPCLVEELVSPGQIGMVPASSMRWAPQTVWDQIYGAFGMPVPEERMTMTRDKRKQVAPYFNAGLIVVDERWRTAKGQRFAEVWMDCAQVLDRTGIESRRPYLDQMTLPVATLAAGMTWNVLPEKYNYSINGMMRGKPIPAEADVTLLHYRGRVILEEAGMKDVPDRFLADQVGTSRVRWVFKVPPPAGIPLIGPEGSLPDLPPEPAEAAEPTHAPPPVFGPDPSKARMAAVTMVKGDHAFLARWVDYYGGLIGRENLYVLRHGHDAEIDRIADGANIVHQPDTGDGVPLDDRRWATLSHFTSGLTLYYNWVLCTDVDEIVAPDPATGQALPDYLDAMFATGRAPQVVSPFGIEMVDAPATGPAHPVLAERRDFRLNAGLAKPCITRKRIAFAPGGQGSTVRDVTLDPKLFLFKLRGADGNPAPVGGPAPAEQAEFPAFVAAMAKGRVQSDQGHWVMPEMRSAEIYRLPARFAGLF